MFAWLDSNFEVNGLWFTSVLGTTCLVVHAAYPELFLISFFLKQARWYLKAAEGGYVRAMYNISLCYSFGEGMVQSHQQARKWMKRAADRGHNKAQYEHGLNLFSVCS